MAWFQPSGGAVSRNRLQNRKFNSDSVQTMLPAKFRDAMALLLDAHRYSEKTNSDQWEFAVEIQQIHELGFTKNDLRFLVREHLVEHASEVTIVGHDGRQFQSTGDLTFTDRTCMVLTASGVLAAIESSERQSDNDGTRPFIVRPADETNGTVVPAWDPDRRVFSINGTTVKHFKWSAANQEAILAAFEEEGWPSRIDDPLPPQPEQDAKRRLSDTIKCLNRKQTNSLVHFRGDGTGEGVVWEFVRPVFSSNGTG